MSNQFQSKRHKSFLENQPDNKYTHFFINNEGKNSVDNTNNTSNLLSNSNHNRSKNDSADLNISSEDDFQKEIENKLNLINETSLEDENFSINVDNRSNSNNHLECNKDDFTNFLKNLENSNNKNFTNFKNNAYNNNDNNYINNETYSEESDCFNEFHDFNNNNNNNNNFNSLNNNQIYNSNFVCNSKSISNMKANNLKKRHSHPVNNFNNFNNNNNNYLCNQGGNQKNFMATEHPYNKSFAYNNGLLNNNCLNLNSNNNNLTNVRKISNVNDINKNFNCNKLATLPAHFYNVSTPDINQSQIHITNLSNKNCNIQSINNSNTLNNEQINLNYLPNCFNEARKNSIPTPYSQEESDNSIDNFTCTNNFQIQENLFAYKNLSANRRKSFNCLNNNANIFGQDLFCLSPKKSVMNPMLARRSFINPGLKNSANYFNANLLNNGTNDFNGNNNDNSENFSGPFESKSYAEVNNAYYNNIDCYANRVSTDTESNFFNPNCNNPNLYAMPGSNSNVNGNIKNVFPCNFNNNANLQQINYYKIQAQAAAMKMPLINNCMYNSPNLNHNTAIIQNNSNANFINNLNNNSDNYNSFNNTQNKFAKNSNQKLNQKIFNNINCSNTSIIQPNQSQSFSNSKISKNLNLNQTSLIIQTDLNKYDDNYLIENIRNFLKDQNGCRLLQKKIEEKKYDLIMAFYEAVVKSPICIETVKDQFGNYVMQKFLEIIFKDKLIMTTFFEKIQSDIFTVCINLYGTRVFQKALDLLDKNYHYIENDKINNVFKNLVLQHMMQLIIDTNGNHVFLKVIGIYPKDKNEFIFDELLLKSNEIAKLKQGGTVFQKAFEHGNKSQKDKLVFAILNHISELINDEYGNFIIQQIIFIKDMDYSRIIVEYICNNVLMLSQQKFSSNVIDKCILLDDEENNNYIRVSIINVIIDKKIIGELLIDQYGNYVVQKSLIKSDEKNFHKIIEEIKSNLSFILSKPFGRKIYDNLVKNYSECLGSQTSKQIFNSQDDKYKHLNQSIKKSRKNEHEKNTII